MLIPRRVVVSFFSGSKGGTGKTTLAVNTAIALSVDLGNVVLVDFGIDGTYMASQMLGVNPSSTGILDYLYADAKPEVRRSGVVSSVFVVPPGTIKSVHLLAAGFGKVSLNMAPLPALVNKFNMVIATITSETMAEVVVIDLPANMSSTFYVAALVNSNIVNLVVPYALNALDILENVDSEIRSIIQRKIVNVILNGRMPGMDNVTNRVLGYAYNGFVAEIPYSPSVDWITKNLKPFMLFKPRADLVEFRKAFDGYVKSLKRQIQSLLGMGGRL